MVAGPQWSPTNLVLKPNAVFWVGDALYVLGRFPGAQPQKLFDATLQPALAVDASNVYFSDDTRVYQGPRGGGVRTLLGETIYTADLGNGVTLTGGGKVLGIAATATDVWYVVQGWSGADRSVIVKAPIGGATPAVVMVGTIGAAVPPAALSATSLQSDPTHLYWLANGDSIYRLPATALPGASPELFFHSDDIIEAFTMDATSVYFIQLHDSTVTRKHK